MTGVIEMSSVSYEKGNWLRYTLWGVALLAIAVLIITFLQVISDGGSQAIPPGYKFAVTDSRDNDEGTGSEVTTYYVYDDRILVDNETIKDRKTSETIMIYDGLNTRELVAAAEEANKDCDQDSCRKNPKVVAKVKKFISGRVGREYTGLK